MIFCKTCKAEIPPAFVNAIQKGECPGCGSSLFSPEDKELLEELTAAMERMPNNPQGLAGWLISNYRFQKIGDAQPTEKFHTKPDPETALPEYNLKVANNPVQTLLKRTDAYKNIQATRAKLQGQGQSHNSQLSQVVAEITAIEDDKYGGEVIDQYEEEIYEERGPKLSQQLVTGSAFTDPSVQALSPEEIAILQGAIQSEEDSHEALQAQRLKRLRAQQGVAGGGGTGSFRRKG